MTTAAPPNGHSFCFLDVLPDETLCSLPNVDGRPSVGLMLLRDGRLIRCSEQVYRDFHEWQKNGRPAMQGNMPITGAKRIG